MADELPPLEPMPESNISPEMIGQLEHSAQWASTFGGGDTNIALRARHNADISDYANALAAQRQTAQAQALQHDKAAQDLYFGMARMNLQEQEAQQRMQHAAELHPLKVQAQQANIQADLARERASVSSALVQAAKTKAVAEAQATADSDTLQFVNGEAQLAKQFGRNSDAYHQGLLDLHVATPAGDQQFKAPYVSSAIKATEKLDAPVPVDAASLVPKPGYIIGHYLEDSAGKSHAVFIPDPALKQGRAAQQDTYAKFDKELKAMVDAYGDESKVPASEWARFEARKKAIPAAVIPVPAGNKPPLTDIFK